MGGKTATLKTVGLLTLMVQAGMHIPVAEGSTLPIWGKIFADIGDEQNLEESISTFSSHVVHLNEILLRADEHSLVLLDEVGSGTDPEEGAALGSAILDELRSRKTQVIITSHLNLLKAYGFSHPDVLNVSVGFNPITLKPTFKLVFGVPGTSKALETASHLGISAQILSHAKSYLKENDRRILALTEHLEDTLQKLNAIKINFEETLNAGARYEEIMAKFVDNVKGKQKILIDHVGKKTQRLFREIEIEVKNLRKSNFSFDLAILDEAHKTVGIKSKTFATLLLDKNIQVGKRIFMTATEKIFRGDDEEVLSMDDVNTYGDLFYQLTFKEAIHANPQIICDYKVLTISVTNDEIKQLIASNRILIDDLKNLEEQESQSLASAIALRKAIQNYGIKHIISFHKNIKGANNFTKLNNTLNCGGLDNLVLSSYHISSKKSAGERARLMNDFITENPALITNARCLTEGVDIPSVDCVLFSDPKQSVIDIVQSSGRALRPFTGKEFGYIMLPMIVPDNILLEEFTNSTPFKEVIRIITALSIQDEMIAEEFRTISSGKQPTGGKIIIDGKVPLGIKLDLSDFASKISAKIWERVA